MADTLQLHVQTRSAQKKRVQALRVKGVIPAVLYGHGKNNQIIQME
ncbi:MAG: hypothetical protein ACD_43C00211G0004, partial [uncultured bacterium]